MPRLRIAALSLAALALTGVLAACGGSSDEVPADAIAVVGGRDIPRAEYDQLITRTKTAYKNAGRTFPKAGTPEFNALKSQAVTWLVQKAQYEEKAEDLDISVSEQDIDKKLREVKQQFFQNDQSQYEKALKQQGYTEKELRDTLRVQLIQDDIFKKVTDDVEVADADIQKFYEKNKTQRYTTPPSRDVRHILISVCANGQAKTEGCLPNDEARAKADQLYDQLKAGASFAALAKKNSGDPSSKDNGGKLTVVEGQTVAPFNQTAFSLGVHVLSRPVKTQYGYHIIEPLSRIKPKAVQPLSKVKEQIRQELLQSKKNEAMTTWVKDTREDFCDGDLSFQIGFKPNPDPCKPQGTTSTGT